jgi:deazaflavin-dependent oxidoreductase (nitroreductase family)
MKLTMDPIAIARRSNRIANERARSQRAFGYLHARLYRLTGGRFLPRWFGAPVLVLETVGRRSGKRRATPVLYLRDGETLVVLAANAGAERVPAWWLNLRAAGVATAVLGGERSTVRPRLLEGEERRRLWHAFGQMYPQIDEYERLAGHELALIALQPT